MTEQKQEEKTMTRSDYEQLVSKKTWEDPKFLEELRRDPKGVLEKFVEKPLPASLEVVLVEDQPNKIYFRILRNPAELSDEELDGIAGGWDSHDTTNVASTVASTVATVGVVVACA
ncbi:NHLP leader peptide family RiPP precursor [Sporomusa malonica]|uniref:NHLP leader peptide domain-containing protein n=1 Tax=Sporomusa malonica TaxID=112901 RepID=A0A1W2CXP3_9FIRM|nr:NHLP leader peptide family RiPP precursor [Sporomusa malonica]SMC89468.1 NHLP leader peptide domain-containing protein [Sporomusa malonica]